MKFDILKFIPFKGKVKVGLRHYACIDKEVLDQVWQRLEDSKFRLRGLREKDLLPSTW